MLHLANAELTVDLLDPAAEYARLGPRFCWGGFIWQIHDHQVGSLLTGPEWPATAPQPHNGQGLPESFRHSTTTGQPLLWEEGVGLAPGAGALGRDAQGAVVVTEPCRWQIEVTATRTSFRTEQSVGRWAYSLERTIELRDRQIISHSRLVNRAATPLRLEWFAHPFFALQQDGRFKATLPADLGLPTNPAYSLSNGELTLNRAFHGVDDGHLVLLELPPNQPFGVTLTHPRLKSVRFTTNFTPLKCVLWANGNTVSFEPFLALDLGPGESREWNLTYEFGPVSP